MKKNACLTALAASATLLAGCTVHLVKTDPDRPVQCLQPDTVAETCVRKGAGANAQLVCPVYVFETPKGVVVYPYTLQVPPGKKLTVVWRLLTKSAVFNAEDGPQEFKKHDQFSNAGPTNDEDGEPGDGKPANRYRIDFANTQEGQKFNYTIALRNAAGARLACDPTIINVGN